MRYKIHPSVRKEAEKIFRSQNLSYVLSRLSEKDLPMERSGPPPRDRLRFLARVTVPHQRRYRMQVLEPWKRFTI
jgi:hypothetical protein